MKKYLILMMIMVVAYGQLKAGINFQSDVRLRYQYQDKEGSVPRARGRVRFRLRGDVQVNDSMSAGFRLATGSDDPTSTNQTLQRSFSTHDMRFDYAFIKYSAEGMGLLGGKFTNSSLLWTPSDLIWGGDVNPEGIALSYKNQGLFLNSGILVLDEQGGTKDPLMYVAQAGKTFDLDWNISANAAVTYYGFENVKGGAPLPKASKTNATDNNTGNLIYDYNAIAAGLSLNLDYTFIDGIRLSGEFITNPDSNDTGYLAEVSLNDLIYEKLPWRLTYGYRRLENDAWIDTTQDGSAYGGKTGIEGSKASFSVDVARNTTLSAVYFDMHSLDNDALPERLLQLNVSVSM